MTEKLFFVTDAALIDRLGRELVTKQETALIELVKNAYDADATNVNVTVEPGNILSIEDNGTGMTREELVGGFLRLASNAKARQPVSSRYQRRRAGKKGIGRFAAQRLGEHLRLRTWSDGAKVGHELLVDWRDFQAEIRLEDVPVRLSEIHPRSPGTIVEVRKLRDTWNKSQLQRCWRGVMKLQQPFPIAAAAESSTEDPGFTVRIAVKGADLVEEQTVVDLESEVFRHSHALIELKVDDVGKAEWRLTKNAFGTIRGWTPINHHYRDSAQSPEYTTLNNVKMYAHYFILDRSLFPSTVYGRLRSILRMQGGMRLYRNGFRVVPYGDPGDDWLGLDETYAQRGTVLPPIRNINFFGFVEVQDPEGLNFDENTSREGLIETEAFEEVRGLASSVIATAVLQVAKDRGRKRSAGGLPKDQDKAPLEKIREAERQFRKKVGETGSGAESPDSSGDPVTSSQATVAREIADLLRRSGDVIEKREADLADESAILRLLATLGLTAAEFSHETGMTFEAVQISFRNVFDVAREVRKDDLQFQMDVDRADSMVKRLVALTSYLNSLASSRSVRRLVPVSVAGEVDKFKEGVAKHANRQGIDVEVKIPDIDSLYTTPMHEADIATILLNFYSNAIKAMRRTSKTRRLLIDAKRESPNKILVRFSDTGDGIPMENREKVFDLFFTTRVSAPTGVDPDEYITGTGLGLWIVRQVVANAGGEVWVGKEPPGYATCIAVRLPGEELKAGK